MSPREQADVTFVQLEFPTYEQWVAQKRLARSPAHRPSGGSRVAMDRLRPVLMRWLQTRETSSPIEDLSHESGFSVDVLYKLLYARDTVSADRADRLLCSIDSTYLWHVPAEDGGLADIYDELVFTPDVERGAVTVRVSRGAGNEVDVEIAYLHGFRVDDNVIQEGRRPRYRITALMSCAVLPAEADFHSCTHGPAPHTIRVIVRSDSMSRHGTRRPQKALRLRDELAALAEACRAGIVIDERERRAA